MNERRSGAAIVSLKGKLHVCGGFSGQEFLDTMEMYETQIEQWTLLERISTYRSVVGMDKITDFL